MSVQHWIDIALLVLLTNHTVKIWTLQRENRKLWRILKILTEMSNSNAKSIRDLYACDKEVLDRWEEFLKRFK